MLCLLALLSTGCDSGADDRVHLSLSASNVGREGELLRKQLTQFEARHPNVTVQLEQTPDAADQRHQLYVQWLNAASGPDVLQLDVVWTPEFAAAGWLLPVSDLVTREDDFFAATLRANRFHGDLYAVPWFVDVGMLYYRKDLIDRPPETLGELHRLAREHARWGTEYGLVWQSARYEGLVTNFLEVLTAFGGRMLGPHDTVELDSKASSEAVDYMRELLKDGSVPRDALAWQEEQTRFAFQNGRALFMRNWPYAYPLLQGEDSRVRGKVGVMPLPGTPQGRAAATLGGAQLGIRAGTKHPVEAKQLVEYLTAPEQMRARALALGQLPPRPRLFDDPSLAHAFGPSPREMKQIVQSSVVRPPHPLYSEISDELQIALHRALSNRDPSAKPLQAAASRVQALLDRYGPGKKPPTRYGHLAAVVASLLVLALAAFGWRRIRRFELSKGTPPEPGAWKLLAPALAVLFVSALLPLGATLWQSLFPLDLRMPWTHSAAPSLVNYRELLSDPHLHGALARTGFFVVTSVALEVLFGLCFALLLHGTAKQLGLARALVLLPWAVPTVVAGLVFRFAFEGAGSPANLALTATGLARAPVSWLTDSGAAWVPVVMADVWKTTPFVSLLFLAGLSNIDPRLYEAAAVDGAFSWQKFWHVTWPSLRPTLVVVVLFRSLDALRVFDLIYVLTQGGPGTSTEPLALYTFTTLFSQLRFGRGAALSVLIVALAAAFSAVFVNWLGKERRP